MEKFVKGEIGMEELKQAVITDDGKIKCPICYKTNGQVHINTFVRNYVIRCRGSRRNNEHFFVLNFGEEL